MSPRFLYVCPFSYMSVPVLSPFLSPFCPIRIYMSVPLRHMCLSPFCPLSVPFAYVNTLSPSYTLTHTVPHCRLKTPPVASLSKATNNHARQTTMLDRTHGDRTHGDCTPCGARITEDEDAHFAPAHAGPGAAPRVCPIRNYTVWSRARRRIQ